MAGNIWLWLRYFVFYPIFSLIPPPYPYLFSRLLSRLDYWRSSGKRRAIQKWMVALLEKPLLENGKLDQAIRRYFEVIYCDEIDNFIYLLGFSKWFLRRLRIEGQENLNNVLNRGGAAILICYHFGGGFWVLPFLREKGVRIQFFSRDIRKEDYPSGKALFYFYRLSNWTIGRMFDRDVSYKGGGRSSLIQALQEGFWVTTAFDAPPYLIKESTEVDFLGRRTRFPKGLVSMAKALDVPILPFFSFLEAGKERRICFERPLYVDDEQKAVEQCVRLLEERIMERPDHWHLWPTAEDFFACSS